MPKNAKFHFRLRTVFVLAIRLELTGNSRNWSCAYDSVCVPLFHTLRTRSLDFVNAVSFLSPFMAFLCNGNSLLTETSDFQHHLNKLRDGLRDKLRVVHGSHVLGKRPSECLNCYVGLLDPGPSKQLADWIAPTATSHVYRTCGHWAIMPRTPMCKLFTIYMDSIDIAWSVLV